MSCIWTLPSPLLCPPIKDKAVWITLDSWMNYNLAITVALDFFGMEVHVTLINLEHIIFHYYFCNNMHMRDSVYTFVLHLVNRGVIIWEILLQDT